MSPKLIFEYPQKEAVLKSWDTNEKKISDDLNSIRNWLKKHPYLPRNLNISELKLKTKMIFFNYIKIYFLLR